MNQEIEMLSNEEWQKAEMLPGDKKMECIQAIKRSSKATHIAILVILVIMVLPIAIIMLMSFNIWLFLTVLIILLGTWLFFRKDCKDDNLLIKNINENNFEFFIEEARHIDEYEHVNNRRNKHYGSVFLTNDVIFIQPNNEKKLYSFTFSTEDKTMSRIGNLEWHFELDFEKPDSLILDEYLKNALEKADGIYIPIKRKNFSAKDHLNRKISFGKGSIFWEYADIKKREKQFPKAFQWTFGVVEGIRYVTESRGDDSEVVAKNLYVSGLNCSPCYVPAGEPVILIRNLSTGKITVRKLKFEN